MADLLAGQRALVVGGGSGIGVGAARLLAWDGAAVTIAGRTASYAAGKAAVDQLVRVAADELGELGVRVNSVRPGFTRTSAPTGTFADPTMLAAFTSGQALSRPGEVEDIAAAVRFLAGPESAGSPAPPHRRRWPHPSRLARPPRAAGPPRRR
jgi:NAD(P)-dependent dehydrogenase (short-subunit alcohol dehydrogenase family)